MSGALFLGGSYDNVVLNVPDGATAWQLPIPTRVIPRFPGDYLSDYSSLGVENYNLRTARFGQTRKRDESGAYGQEFSVSAFVLDTLRMTDLELFYACINPVALARRS